MKSLIILGLLLGLNVNPLNENNYVLGTHLEAEDFAKNMTVITNNSNASGGKAIDAGDSGSITYEFNMEKEGEYRLAIGYYTGGNSPKMKVKINDGNEVEYALDVLNGWCKDTKRLPIAKDINVNLKKGKNTITIKASGPWVNFDYIAIFNLDDPYEDYEMYNHLKADGSRIQAEWCRDVVGNYSDKNIRIVDAADGTDGHLLSVDDDYLSTPGWVVEASEEGEYILQVAYYGASGSSATYKWNINGTNKYLQFPACPANWDYNAYSSKIEFKVNLKEGKNVIYYNYNQAGYADFDWFRLFKRETSLDTKLEAEDFVIGDASTQKDSDKYPFVSNYVVELAKGKVAFDIEVNEKGTYSLFTSTYTNTYGAYQYVSINGNKTKIVYDDNKINGWIDDVTQSNLVRFNIELEQGVNKIEITKGDDSTQYNYVDLDFFYISKGGISTNNIEVDSNTKEIDLSSIINLSFDYEIKSSNESIVSVDNNKIKVNKAGKTSIKVCYNYSGYEFEEIIYVTINKQQYTGNELKALDTTKTYTGQSLTVDVEMGEGWSFKQDKTCINVGTYEVKVTFTHDDYESIEMTATLTINKAVYEGNDIVCEDMTYTYDGNIKSIIATAPDGWEISYTNNSHSEKGEYEVKVTFTNPNYETIEKTVTLTIEGSMNALPFIIGGVGIVGLGVAAFFVIKKKKK